MEDISVKNRKTFFQFSPSPGRYPFGGPNLRFTDLSIVPKPMIDKTGIKPNGQFFKSRNQRGLEWSDHSLENAFLGLVSISFLLEMFVGAPEITEVGASSFLRMYEPKPGLTPRDVAMHYGERLKQLEQYLYVHLTGLGIKGDKKTITLSGTGKGRQVEYLGAASGASSITDIPIVSPNPPTDGLFLSPTYSGLGAVGAESVAPIRRFMEIDFNCGGMLEVVEEKAPGTLSWVKPLETDNATGTVSITRGNNSDAWAFLSNIRNDEPFYLRYLVRGPELEEGTPEVQTINLSGDDDPTGGVWPLTILGVTVNNIPWNVSAAELQAVIRSLDVYGAADVTVGKAGFLYTLTFPSYLGNVSQVTSNNGATLTGGVGDTFAITINTTMPGAANLPYLFALDCGVDFDAHFNPASQSSLSTLVWPMGLIENEHITGWRVWTLSPYADLDTLSLAA